MNLVIDIGNTSVKLHLFKNDEKIISETLNENTFIASLTALKVKYSIQNVIISSVTSNYKIELTKIFRNSNLYDLSCLLYTSDAADDSLRVDLGGRRIIKKYRRASRRRLATTTHWVFFSSRRRHTRFMSVSWARRCV